LTTARAYGQPNQEHAEFWPETQLRYGIDGATTATLMSRLRVSTGPRGLYLAEQEASVSHDFIGWFAAGGGFHHSSSTSGGPFQVQRLLANQVLRVQLPNAFRVDFRTHEEIRWLTQGFSVRLRERALTQRRVEIGKYGFTPYASAEVFWHSRVDTFDRYRLTAGAALPVYRGLSVAPYFMHEVNYGFSTVVRDIVGFNMIATF
jgi:hypothetical protein